MTLPKGKAEGGAETLHKLKSSLGSTLLEVILGVNYRTINKWIKGEVTPSPETVKLINLTYYVWESLCGSVSERDGKLWLVSHSDYLYGIPAVEIRNRPEDVYLAALNRVSRGETREQLENLHDSHESQTDGI